MVSRQATPSPSPFKNFSSGDGDDDGGDDGDDDDDSDRDALTPPVENIRGADADKVRGAGRRLVSENNGGVLVSKVWRVQRLLCRY